MITVEFNKKNHTYLCSNGVILPGVTTIIKEVLNPYKFLPPPNKQLLEWQGKRGTGLHKAIEYDLTKALDLDSIKGIIEPYFKSWLQVKDFLEIEVICFEKMVFSLRLGFAGTKDLRAKVRVNKQEYIATIDFKTSKNWWEHFKYQPPLYQIGWYEPQYYLEKKLDFVRLWGMNGHQIALPKDHLSELYIIILLQQDGSFPYMKIFPRKEDKPYELVSESLEILRKYHESHVGWNPEKLFGKEYV